MFETKPLQIAQTVYKQANAWLVSTGTTIASPLTPLWQRFLKIAIVQAFCKLSPLERAGFIGCILNAYAILMGLRPELLIYALLKNDLSPFLEHFGHPHLATARLLLALSGVIGFTHTLVDWQQGKHHSQAVIKRPLEFALGELYLPEPVREKAAVVYRDGDERLAHEALQKRYGGCVQSAFDAYCRAAADIRNVAKLPYVTPQQGFLDFLIAHAPKNDSVLQVLRDLPNGQRNPIAKSSLISCLAESLRLVSGIFLGSPYMVQEALAGIGKKTIIITASLRPRILAIWQAQNRRVYFNEHPFLRLPNHPVLRDLGRCLDLAYASAALFGLLVIYPRYASEALHYLTLEWDHVFLHLPQGIWSSLVQHQDPKYALMSLLLMPIGYLMAMQVTNRDPITEVSKGIRNEPAHWLPLDLLLELAGEGTEEKQRLRLAALMGDGNAVIALKRLHPPAASFPRDGTPEQMQAWLEEHSILK